MRLKMREWSSIYSWHNPCWLDSSNSRGLSPRIGNIIANELASLASNALYPCHVDISIMDHPSIYSAAVPTAESRAGQF